MPQDSEERLRKWRLILGQQAESSEAEQDDWGAEDQGMEDVLSALYESDREGGLGSSAPSINRWLGDIRKYFPTSVVQMMQRDALERLDLTEMLLEPELLESVQPDVHLVGTLLTLKKLLPEETKSTARELVRRVVEDLEKKLRAPLQEAIKGALNRSVRNRRPKFNEINWHRTIKANLRHYQEDLKTIIPEQLYGYGRKGQSLRQVILLVDQSGSMAASLVYASVVGAVMASIRSLRTHFVVFDTSVVDLTEFLTDPVDLLFGTQLGGGTDIHQALTYAEQLIEQPHDTIVVLISDLYESSSAGPLLQRAKAIHESGAQLISLLALDDEGAPSYDREVAAALKQLGIPAFACTPDKFPDLMAAAINRDL